MKSLPYIVTRSLIAYSLFFLIIPTGVTQTQDSYFDAVQQWETYYDQHSDLKDPPSHEYKIYMRWKSFWDNRIYCSDSTISGTKHVIQNAMKFYLDNLDYYSDASGVGADWHQVGPYYDTNQQNGLVSAIWVDTIGDPSFQTIYIGTNSSGIWKTTNGGSDWINLTDRYGLNLLGVSDIVGDPNNANTLYASSGGENYGRSFSYSMGILRTEDGGDTWDIIYGLDPAQQISVNCLLIDPYNTNILYAGIKDQLVRFTKTGTDWIPSIIATIPQDSGWVPGNIRKIRDIEMKPGAPDTLYIATDNKHWKGTRKAVIYRIIRANTSTPDTQRIDQSLPADGALLHSERFELAVTPQYPNWLYAQASYYPNNIDSILIDTVYKHGPYFAIWRSKDNGVTWEKKYQEFVNTYYTTNLMGCGRVEYFKNELILNPKDTSVFYVCGNQMTRVDDWQNTYTTEYHMNGSSGCHPDIRDAMLVSSTMGDHGENDKIFVGNDGGISKTLDGNESWININGDHLILTDFYSIGGVEALEENIWGGTIDNGFFMFDGTDWINATGNGESTQTRVDAQSPQYVYSQSLMSGDVTYRSFDSGNSFSGYLSTPQQTGDANRGLDLNPLNQKSLYTGAYDIFKTISVRDPTQDTVVKIRVHIGGDYAAIDSGQRIISIAVSNIDTNILYIAYAGPHDGQDLRKHKLLKTVNEGQTFIDLLNSGYNDTLMTALEHLGITDICLSPYDSNKIWVSLGGFDSNPAPPSDVTKRVFYSNDAGNSFSDISQGLPNFPVNCITYWVGGNDRLFAGTDIGVYYRDAFMDHWVPFNAEMPKAIVTEIVVLPNYEIIRASTYGRGIYESTLTCAFVSDTLFITSDTNWTQPFTADRSILVKSPAVLTIQTTVRFPPEAKIMVEQGGTLIVDGGTLTNACFNMWQGIEVWGHSNLSQSPTSNQGLVSIRGNSVIENARFGVSTGATDSEGNIIWSTVGGIVRGYYSTFKNNYKDIQIMPYSYTNASRFQNVVFETTGNLIDGRSYPSDHVSLCGVHGVSFWGCTFRNTTPLNISEPIYFRGNGIRSINAGYTVTGLCISQEQPCTNLLRGFFSNLNYGILTYNSQPANAIKIELSDFLDNRRSIYLGNADYATVISNSFTIPVWSDFDTCYGLYLGSCTGYHVEGNEFEAPGNSLFQPGPFTPPIREIGLIVDNSGGQPNEIYRNYFENLDIAINAQGVNRYDDGSAIDPGSNEDGPPANYTGLVLKCNIYHDNSFDEVITRENPTGTEGIARDQGSPSPATKEDLAGNTFSPYHETAQIAETDIKNEGNFVFYYHHIQAGGYNPPRVEPDFYTTSLVDPDQKGYGFDSACCPSRLESGGSQEEMKEAMAGETESVDLLLAEYVSLVDGGNTEALNEDVFFSIPPEAIPLHQDLLGESPYLSDTVMKSAIAKEEVLPNAMIRDILVANPQSAKSNAILDELNNRFVQMPEPMMDEILAGQTQISAKETLEGEIAFHKAKRQDLFYQLVRSYRADTINPASRDSLIALLQRESSLKAKYLLAFEYLENGDTSLVANTLNAIPATFTLSNTQEQVYDDYLDYFGILTSLKTEGKSILELSSDQLTVLQNLTAAGREPVGSFARNIVLANQLTEYYEPILLPDMSNPAPSKPNVKPDQITPEEYFKVYPNPAKHYAIIEYSLKDYQNSSNQVIFVITNQEGKVMERIMVQKQQDQFVLNTTSYVPGNFVCTLIIGGKILQSQKFVIIR